MTHAQHTAPEAMVMAFDKVREAFEIPECDRPGCPVCAKQYAEFKAAIAAISGQIREQTLREAAQAVNGYIHPNYPRLPGEPFASAQVLALIEGANHEPC